MDIIKVVDRHIGIWYKKEAYMAFQKEMMNRLRAACKEAGKVDNAPIKALTPAEKRILITHAIGRCHEELLKTNACERAFIATGTWLLVSHLIRDENGVNNGPASVPAESQVKFQHLKEYIQESSKDGEDSMIVCNDGSKDSKWFVYKHFYQKRCTL